MPGTEVKACRKISNRVLILVVAAVLLISNAATGLICWHQADEAAHRRADAEMQTYIVEHSVSRSTTYQRLVNSWTKTLAEVYGDVIFFGDSITAGGLWEEYYPYLTPVNLGVVGDTIEGLMTRLPQIEMLMCEKCFVMIGVNDLNFGSTVEETLQNYQTMLDSFAEMRDELGTQFYLQSVLPVREDATIYEIKNEDVRKLNEGITALADEYEMTYIDVHTLMADDTGALNEAYSFDGLHLTEAGYQVWQELLIPYLNE